MLNAFMRCFGLLRVHNSGDGSDVRLQVAQVSQIFVDKKDNAKFSVYWYYFPDDVKRGRQVCTLLA